MQVWLLKAFAWSGLLQVISELRLGRLLLRLQERQEAQAPEQGADGPVRRYHVAGRQRRRVVRFVAPPAIQASLHRAPRRCDPRARYHQLVPASAEVGLGVALPACPGMCLRVCALCSLCMLVAVAAARMVRWPLTSGQPGTCKLGLEPGRMARYR